MSKTGVVAQLCIAGLAIYLFAHGRALWAVVCVGVIVWLSFSQQIAQLARLAGRLTDVPQEHGANSQLSYTFDLERVFQHPAVDELFAKLQKNSKAPAGTIEEWRNLLAESYCRKYKRDRPGCEVRFEIKNNLLFVNGEVDFFDHVFYTLEIPYRWNDDGEPIEEAPLFQPNSEYRLVVRVLLVNGILRLEVGGFGKEYSPTVYREGSMAVYDSFVAVTSFPLMYFSHQHGIPVRYLNLVVEATPAYKARETDRVTAKKPDSFSDWRTLQAEVAGYRLLCDFDYESFRAMKVRDQFEKTFKEKRDALLAAEGYKTHDFDPDARLPDRGHWYWNQYGRVFFWNRNTHASGFEGRWFAEYMRDEPF